VLLTAVTLEQVRGGQADKTGRQTDKKPPARTAQTAASQQTSNFNSRPPPSQPQLPRGWSVICFRYADQTSTWQ